MTIEGLAIVTLGPFADPEAPTALDARCARLSLVWRDDRPLCCARGADIDGRSRLQLLDRLALAWSHEGPRQHDPAPSGIVERLSDVPFHSASVVCCSALDQDVKAGALRGDGCRIRLKALDEGKREGTWLLDPCALFPLDFVDGVLVPSARIPDEALVPMTEGTRSLWDEARERVTSRFGAAVTTAIDAGVVELYTHRTHGLHLKTLK